MRKGRWYWIGILTTPLIFFVFWFALFLLERGKNPRCNDLFDAFRMVLVLFLGEYEEFAPVTTGGKLIITFSFILGVAVVATVIGKIASFFVKIKREVKMPKETGGHIVICNWNDKGDKIVKEIHSPVAEPETEIYIVTDKDDKEIREEELRVSPEYENVYFIKGDPSLHAVLKNSAKAHLAKSIIILADESSPDPDAKTALISLAITRLETEQAQKPHIIAEVINHRKIQHLLDAGVDEWVCATDYGLGIIAQAALNKKISDVYHQLLTYSEETCEIYLIEGPKLPRSLFGKSFKEAVQFLNEKRGGINPAILIGVKREGRIILNPREGDFDIIKEGDGLVVIAYKLPDLREM